MTRRAALSRLALAAALIATATLASCSTTGTGRDAAKVGEHAISQDDFQQLLDDLTALTVVKPSLVTDSSGAPLDPPTVTGDFARGRLAAWITTAAMTDDLAARGKPVTDAQRASVEQQLESTAGADWALATPRVRQHLIDNNAAGQAFVDSYGDPAATQAAYEQGIEASGYACVAHILVATEEEAQAVLAELAGGADFATVAAERSTDTGSGASGGVLSGQDGSPCMTAADFQSAFVPEFVDGALAAKVGVPTAPVKSDFGYHIILLRPFAEVADVLVPLAANTAAQPHFAELFEAAKITVASRYGHWDNDSLDVVAES